MKNQKARNSSNKGAWDLKFSDLFRGVEFHDGVVDPQITVPDTFYQRLQDFFMERSYLNDTGARRFVDLEESYGRISWLRITHLPVNPSNDASYDLLSRWQGVLSTMHAWNYRLLFLLLRQNGETRLYLGTTSREQGILSGEAAEQLREAACGSMPGIGLESLNGVEEISRQIVRPISQMPDVGAVTGLPSFRESKVEANLQTLDPLAFGLQDQNGRDRNYALLVVADPMQDAEISGLIGRMRELGSQIHSDVKRTVSMSRQASDSKAGNVGAMAALSVGKMLATLLYAIPNVGVPLGIAAHGALGAVGTSVEKKISYTSTGNLNVDYLDKFALACEELTDKHVERMQAGRSTGFWNTGVYVLGSASDIRTVTGLLRSIYSGKESYLEPIRTHLFARESGAKDVVSGFQLLPLITPEALAEIRKLGAHDEAWHIFGKHYQYVSTPVNTSELSLMTSLPRRDVPGLRFVRTAIRFASNPAAAEGETISLGKVVDMGVAQNCDYRMDPNLLVRHALIAGVTGSGKTTTCKNMALELLARDIPVLIIEPAKDDYVRWAMEVNKTLPPEKQFRIYTPGGVGYPGALPLEINLFEPAAIPGARVDLLQHSENMSMLLNASLPSEDVVPILIDEVVYRTLMRYAVDDEFPEYNVDVADAEAWGCYPNADGLLAMAQQVMGEKGYETRVRENMKEVLSTRFNYLRRGYRGMVFNANKSTDYHELFSRPAIINLSRFAGSKEKSLVMSLILLALYEYRASAYQYDETYRTEAQKNRLMHFTLVEEAHNVLSDVPQVASGDPRVAAGDLFRNILLEIRAYGEGLAVIDQMPSSLMPAVVKNTNLKICHRIVAPDDCRMLASTMALRPDQGDMLPALEIGNAIVCGDMDDAATWVKMAMPRREGM